MVWHYNHSAFLLVGIDDLVGFELQPQGELESSYPCNCAIQTPFCKGVILLGTVVCGLKANSSSQGVSGLKGGGSTKGAVG